jgi:ADP-ribose pyrophosphatase YjhB (NUDIX family)
MNYCTDCGAELTQRIPPGDDRLRYVCDACGTVHYQNPKMVVGTIPIWHDKILLCRRAIEPRYGKWTLPAGYLENGETASEGACRETIEEAGAKLDSLVPYALLNLTFVNQIYVMFLGRLLDSEYQAGAESLDVRLFREEEIPWDELAFTVITETLRLYYKDLAKGTFSFHMGDITRRLPPG